MAEYLDLLYGGFYPFTTCIMCLGVLGNLPENILNTTIRTYLYILIVINSISLSIFSMYGMLTPDEIGKYAFFSRTNLMRLLDIMSCVANLAFFAMILSQMINHVDTSTFSTNDTTSFSNCRNIIIAGLILTGVYFIFRGVPTVLNFIEDSPELRGKRLEYREKKATKILEEKARLKSLSDSDRQREERVKALEARVSGISPIQTPSKSPFNITSGELLEKAPEYQSNNEKLEHLKALTKTMYKELYKIRDRMKNHPRSDENSGQFEQIIQAMDRIEHAYESGKIEEMESATKLGRIILHPPEQANRHKGGWPQL